MTKTAPTEIKKPAVTAGFFAKFDKIFYSPAVTVTMILAESILIL
jgi:cell division protein FtsL